MVNAAVKSVQVASVPLRDIRVRSLRLEASVYDMEAINWIKSIQATPSIELLDQRLSSSISYPSRFKRKYVNRAVGTPFLLPSQIRDLIFRPTKWVTGLAPLHAKELTVDEGDILLTRSGNVGALALAHAGFSGYIMSDDLIRIKPASGKRGLLYTFLRSSVGQCLLRSNQYGAVIQHLEPHHLGHLSVPNIEKIKASEIERLISLYHKELTAGSELIRSAIADIETWCGTSGQVQPKQGLPHASVKATEINYRFDASYHGPDVVASEQSMISSARDYRPLSDPIFTTSVVLPTRFKRTYVAATYGKPLVGGKYIGTLDPRNDKHISLDGLTESNRKTIPASPGQILVTRSGTVGKLMLVPAHWEGWALSDHIIRINAVDESMAAYIYAWLSSETGRMQVQRQIYGSVVDELDVDQLSSVLVPVPTPLELKDVSSRIKDGVELWSRAAAAESEALAIMERELDNRWLPPTS